MKIAIIGAGGVGGYFGARLIQSGTEVSFIARGAHLAAMRKDGLQIANTDDDDFHIAQIDAADDPAQIGPVDLILLAVKLPDTAAAIATLKPLFKSATRIVSFQNGVQNDEPLRRAFGDAAVLGGVAYISAFIDRPGVIRHVGKMQKLVFGEFDGRRSSDALAFLAACERAGFDAELAEDIQRRIWEKFVLLVGLSGATSTIRQPAGPIRQNPLARKFLFDLMQETVDVGRTLGISLAADYAKDRLHFVDGLPASMSASMHHDLEQGKRLELMWLSGAVVELGAKAGVATPANRAVRDILALYADGRPVAQ